MKKIINFIQEDWVFKLIVVIIALALGVGSYFNYKADNAIVLELIIVAITSVILIGFMSFLYYRYMKEKTVNMVTLGIGIALSLVFDVLSHLIF